MTSRAPIKCSPRPSMASIHGRSEVDKIAPSDWMRALLAARRIPDGWYRAQALSTVARFAPESALIAILDEAVEAADTCRDEYGMVAVMSWPMDVAIRRGRHSFAERELGRAFALAPKIEPLASRAFALQCLRGGCFPGGERYLGPVWQAILALRPPDRSWRAARLYRHIAEMLESRSPGAAIKVIRAMPDGKARGKLARRFGLAG